MLRRLLLALDYFFAEDLPEDLVEALEDAPEEVPPDFFAAEDLLDEPVVLLDAEEPAADFFAADLVGTADLDDAFDAVLFLLLPVAADLVPVDLAADLVAVVADDFFADDFVELAFEPLAVLVAISYLFSFDFWWVPHDHKILC